jgi:fructose-1,6-bisphosphatase/inositol monophosphatase family enzyme
MPVSDEDISALISILRSVSRTVIMPRFRNLGAGEIGSKSNDDDLVTIADRESEARIAEEVLARWPDAVVVGEEAVSEGRISRAAIGDAERAVIIDPIDGTWNFARGLALFGIILAVAEKGETVAGVLYDPVGDDTVTARKGHGAFMHASDGTIRNLQTAAEKPADRMIGFSGHGLLPKAVQRELALPLTEFRRVSALRCSCHEYRMMAMGHADFCITGGLEPWDHAAGALIVAEAGGHAAMADGSTYAPTRHRGVMITASSKAAWNSVSAIAAAPIAML